VPGAGPAQAHAQELARRLGLSFSDPALLVEALVHSSYVNEHPESDGASNERLEFLGDAVLSLIVSHELWRRHPHEPEGVLTTRRAAVVSTRALAEIAGRLGLGDAIILGLGAQRSGERARSSVLAGAFEALVAAVYLDRGIDAAHRFVLEAAGHLLDAELPMHVLKAPKSRLQEHAYARTGRAPSYRLLSAAGPDHDRRFLVEVSIAGVVMGEGQGRSRREAETRAAEAALATIGGGESVAGERTQAVSG
jgi:ribonuclease-3